MSDNGYVPEWSVESVEHNKPYSIDYSYYSDSSTLYNKFSLECEKAESTKEGSVDFSALKAIYFGTSYLSSPPLRTNAVIFFGEEVEAEAHVRREEYYYLYERVRARSLTKEEAKTLQERLNAIFSTQWKEPFSGFMMNTNPRGLRITFLDGEGHVESYRAVEAEKPFFLGWDDFIALFDWLTEILADSCKYEYRDDSYRPYS